jgi:cellulose synthase/poly-beta-1,6-N-acetylglucosamine synthase-like glycosyltransferase
MKGISVVIPAYNAEGTIGDCLRAAKSLEYAGDLEVIVVNDGSTDKTADIALTFPMVRVISVPNGGAPRATNIGIQAAKYDIVVSLDADAMLERDWLQKVVPLFDDPKIAAVAGYALTGNRSLVGKFMGYDVELRLDRIGPHTDHLYTMNTAYRRQILLEIGMFDESLRIAYDGDISRRLVAKGYRLMLNKDAKCTHYWRDDLKGYLKQQYNYAYYRLEIARKFKKSHDRIAGIGMILQAPFTMMTLLAAILGSLASPLAPLLLILLPVVHLPKTVNLLFKKGDACILALPFLFTLRNFAWIWAAIVWAAKQSPKFISMFIFRRE